MTKDEKKMVLQYIDDNVVVMDQIIKLHIGVNEILRKPHNEMEDYQLKEYKKSLDEAADALEKGYMALFQMTASVKQRILKCEKDKV